MAIMYDDGRLVLRHPSPFRGGVGGGVKRPQHHQASVDTALAIVLDSAASLVSTGRTSSMDTSDFKNGIGIQLDGQIFTIVEFQHVKPGKGGAFVRTRLKNVRSGAVLEKTFRAGEKMEQAILDRRPMNYLYNQDDEYFFMDMESYDQISVPRTLIGDGVKYLKEDTEVQVLRHNDEVIGVDIPFFMELEVIEADPGLRGDTASGGSKPARLETGAVVQVPLFIGVGERIRVDTRTDSYLERAK
jgi:elongation factor P